MDTGENCFFAVSTFGGLGVASFLTEKTNLTLQHDSSLDFQTR